jgi:hypothetical protein
VLTAVGNTSVRSLSRLHADPGPQVSRTAAG